ncbi:hypothetical protein JZ751_026908 [Albula glossodonta]|uniref:D-aminoacyl-tRNA deacylase 1 n=1 Tax=Albula glossodonta TaxID=121402 RepID=A0A8T2PL77_9TELE|nr:hypothetical protein JZ751_026908 [Albula glossodonta]
MNLKDVSKWNARVALVYAVGVWTLLGATIYTHMESQARKKDDAEHTEVAGEQVSAIERGICVLLGISVEDTQKDVDYIVRKILNLRLFEDENGRAWSKSVMDRELEVLCVSQFTLQCILKGNKPDFHSAMPAELAQPFYNSILEHMRNAYRPELIKGEARL